MIAVTAVFFGPRLTFLCPAGLGRGRGRLRAGQPDRRRLKLAAAGKLKLARGVLPAYRGDGPIAYRLGGLVQGQLPPLPPLLVGLLVTCDLAVLGLANLSGLLIFAPVMAMLLAALGARHPHDGRLDWLVPSLLLAGEGVFLAGLGFSRHVWLPVIFALLAAVVCGTPTSPTGPGPGGASRTTSSAWAGTGGCCWPGWPPWSASCRSPTRCWPPGSGCWPAGTSSAPG